MENCGNSSAVTVMKLIDWKSSEGPFQKKIDILNMGKEFYFFLEETQNIF